MPAKTPVPDFIPYSREFLRTCGSDSCPCCQGSGVAHGFGIYGRLCPCVFQCEWCLQPLPIDDEHFDEGHPRTYEGMPSCPACIARMRREDAQTCDPEYVIDYPDSAERS